MLPPDKCIECGASSPVAGSDDTLSFSSSTGWRISLRREADGSCRAEWRCPTCWSNYRSSGGHLLAPQSGARASRPR